MPNYTPNPTTAQNAWNQFAHQSLQNSAPSSYQFGGQQQGYGQFGGAQGQFDPHNPGTSQQTIQQINNASQQQGVNNIGGSIGAPAWTPAANGTPGSTFLWGGAPSMAGADPNAAGGGAGGSGGTGGGSGGTGGAGGLGQVSSTIDGQSPIYDEGLIQRLTNRAVGDARTAADPRYQMKKFTRPGLSHDEGTLSAAMPAIAGANQDAFNAMGEIPLMADFANRNYKLQGQAAGGQEALALASLLQGSQQLGDYNDIQGANQYASMIPNIIQLLG